MEDHITPDRIRNSILMDVSFKGYYLLVEGKKDIKLYKRLLIEDEIKIRPTFGKYNMRTIFNGLTDSNFSRKIAIRDADFLRLKNNEKYDANFSQDLFATDCHDSEIMMLNNGCLSDFLIIVSNEEKVKSFEIAQEKTIQEILFSFLYNLGCLKLANKRHDLGLVFKPKDTSGPTLKLDKFICDKNWVYLGHEKMIQTVRDYSNNKSQKIASKEDILEKLLLVIKEEHSREEIVHGHDAAELLRMIAKSGLKCDYKGIPDSDCVEALLVMGFDLLKFAKTNLYGRLKNWEQSSDITLLKPI